MNRRQSFKKAVWIILGCGAIVFAGMSVGRVFLRKNVYTLVLFERLFTDKELLANLEEDNRLLRINSLAMLEDRRNPAAVPYAEKLLRDDRDWIHGAMYLAAMGKKEAIPYLIAGLRHPASGLHRHCGELLRLLTGEHFGEDYEAWRRWWSEKYPDQLFDFESLINSAITARRRDMEPAMSPEEEKEVSRWAEDWVRLMAEGKLQQAWERSTRRFRKSVGGFDTFRSDYLSLARPDGVAAVRTEGVRRLRGKYRRRAIVYKASVVLMDSQNKDWQFLVWVVRSGTQFKVESFTFRPRQLKSRQKELGLGTVRADSMIGK